MSLAAEALFDGEPCAHAVAFYERRRMQRIERNFDRVRLPVDASDAARFPNFALAAADLAAMPAAERERLNAEWRTA